jgi:hypothetical protein
MGMRLMVGSFSRRFVRISPETCVNVRREIQEREDALRHAREGSKMMAPAVAFTDDAQHHLVKGLLRELHHCAIHEGL